MHDPSVCKKMLMHIPVTLFAYKHRLCSVTTTIYYTSVGKRYEKVFLFGRAAKRCMVPVIPRELKTWPGRGMSSGHTSLFFSVNNCNSMWCQCVFLISNLSYILHILIVKNGIFLDWSLMNCQFFLPDRGDPLASLLVLPGLQGALLAAYVYWQSLAKDLTNL